MRNKAVIIVLCVLVMGIAPWPACKLPYAETDCVYYDLPSGRYLGSRNPLLIWGNCDAVMPDREFDITPIGGSVIFVENDSLCTNTTVRYEYSLDMLYEVEIIDTITRLSDISGCFSLWSLRSLYYEDLVCFEMYLIGFCRWEDKNIRQD